MKANEIRVGVLCGGRSAEHEIALLSAQNVISALDQTRYHIALITIDKQGRWRRHDDPAPLVMAKTPSLCDLLGDNPDAVPSVSPWDALQGIDVVFPVLHGPNGEDGTVQGLLASLGMPYVGASVLGSAVCMDKDVTKRLLVEAGLLVAKCLVIQKAARGAVVYQDVVDQLGSPCYIKPANMGSSVGISRVDNQQAFCDALDQAFQFDHKVLVEENIVGREIECAVLGNGHPEASLPGEIIPRDGFYSYQIKYVDEKGAQLMVPAKLSDGLIEKIQALAIQSYQVLCCEGMARVDFLLRGEEIYVSEVNTIPGFTPISMYPKLWEVSGLPQPQLMDRLIELAFLRHQADLALRVDYGG